MTAPAEALVVGVASGFCGAPLALLTFAVLGDGVLDPFLEDGAGDGEDEAASSEGAMPKIPS